MLKPTTLVFFWLSVSLCQAQADKESQHLIDLHKKKFSWLINKNYDSLQLSLDEKLMYIHSNGWTETKKDIIDNLKSAVVAYTKSDVVEAQARVFGNTGIVTGKGKFQGEARGNPFELDLIYTEVYIKFNDNWKLVSRHACRAAGT